MDMSCMQENVMSDFARNRGQTVGMAYVPVQQWKDVYEICHGFQRGTVFAELYKPFKAGKAGKCYD